MNKKIFISIIFSILCVAVLFGVVGIKNYLDKCPVITPKNSVVAEIGSTISIDELADFEKTTSYRILYISSTCDETNAEIKNNGQSLFVGNYDCMLEVTVLAVGENGESDEENVTVNVAIFD